MNKLVDTFVAKRHWLTSGYVEVGVAHDHFHIFTNLCSGPYYTNHPILLSETLVLISARDFMHQHRDWPRHAWKISASPFLSHFDIPYTHTEHWHPDQYLVKTADPLISQKAIATRMSKNTLKDVGALELVHWVRPRDVFLIRHHVLCTFRVL